MHRVPTPKLQTPAQLNGDDDDDLAKPWTLCGFAVGCLLVFFCPFSVCVFVFVCPFQTGPPVFVCCVVVPLLLCVGMFVYTNTSGGLLPSGEG